MSQITIQCRLVASEATRYHLWQLMAEQNTPLINELLKQVAEHPEFETWRQKGKLPAGIVSKLCNPLKEDSRFTGQPGRFYTSAIKLVEYIYKSWLTLQQHLRWKLNGQRHWLEILKSDQQLCQDADCSLESLRHQASEILTSLQTSASKSENNKKSKKQKSSSRYSLFDAYDNAEDNLTRSAIAYLLKNHCKIPEQEENLEKFAQRRRKAEIKVERLTQQIESNLPKGRDLTGEQWLETLLTATDTVPKDKEQFKSWQNLLLTKPKSVPFPINYETNEDLTWIQGFADFESYLYLLAIAKHLNEKYLRLLSLYFHAWTQQYQNKKEKARLSVYFSGLSNYIFQIYCDQRQLKWLQRFYEDQKTKQTSNGQHSSSLFTLRSARIVWQEGTKKGQPWNRNYLTLQCTVDTRLWTAEGTEEVKQEKAEKITQDLAKMKKKGNLKETQKAYVKRLNSTLIGLNHSYPRPSRPVYKGQSHLLVGVAFGLKQPATIAIVDGRTGEAIAYRNTKQLLGKDYKLLNRQRKQKQLQSHQRHKAQKQFAPNQFQNSELGEYIDRLLAKAIIEIAQNYQVGSIVLPELDNIRELIQSEIQMRAEEKIPGCVEKQKEYARRYRIQVHQWSYNRLSESIISKASQQGIEIEKVQQPICKSPQEQAKELAILAYQYRQFS